MKCPKCNYIAFDSTVRCRNCGFDFSLARAVESESDSDLPLRPPEPAAPLADFDLGSAKRPPRGTGVPPANDRVRDPAFDPGVPPATPSEMPLFGEVFFGEKPLVRSTTPTAPLSVRRSTPVPSRPRGPIAPRAAEPGPDPSLPLGSPVFTALGLSGGASAQAQEWVDDAGEGEVAGVGARLGAAVLDWLLLVGLDLVVVYFTLRVSRLQTGEFRLLPAAPLVAFLLLLNGGYLAMFTAAGGQTLGKMAFHLRVVSTGDSPLTVGRSLLRVLSFLVSALPAGLLLLPVAFGPTHRGLHDRLSGTRVVHAGTP